MSARRLRGSLLLHLWSSALLLMLLGSGALASKGVKTSDNITATVGRSATLSCGLSADGTVSQLAWRRCNGEQILVFHIDGKEHVEKNYVQRVSGVTISTFTLTETQRDDRGEYCCTLATFPHGNLEGRIRLHVIEDTGRWFLLTVVVPSVSGILGLVVVAVVTLLLCKTCRRRREESVQVTVHPTGQPQNKRLKTPAHHAHHAHHHAHQQDDPEDGREEEEEDDDDGEGQDYLNVEIFRLPKISPADLSSLLSKR